MDQLNTKTLMLHKSDHSCRIYINGKHLMFSDFTTTETECCDYYY